MIDDVASPPPPFEGWEMAFGCHRLSMLPRSSGLPIICPSSRSTTWSSQRPLGPTRARSVASCGRCVHWVFFR